MEEIMRAEIMDGMQGLISTEQMAILGNVLAKVMVKYNIQVKSNEVGFLDNSNEKLKNRFVASLRLEGKSEKTLEQYALAIDMLLKDVDKRITDITTNDIRYHLAIYQQSGVKNSTVDNRRRNLSSLFSWLAREEFIEKNPMLRIGKIKSTMVVRKAFSDSEIEMLKNASIKTRNPKRDRALIEFLLSTGCRVSEVVNLNISDVDFMRGECVVHGKGNKDRKVYISDKALLYLRNYLSSRKDCSDVLFTNRLNDRWSKQSIEKIIRSIGDMACVSNAHPHRFRRTFATNALNKGMPVQCLQKILGHKSLDTTMVYCNVDDDTIRHEHKKIA